MTERDIFIAALQLEQPAERSAYLDEACAGDVVLRRRVEALFKAHEQSGGFLDKPAGELAATGNFNPDQAPQPPSLRPAADTGAIIAGRYKLLQQIGEGGMGSVFMAEQTQPVKRMVAVKVVKTGLDSKSLLARFEAERQALALMDHPNIAKVLDAGATERGQPFFVMELVKGVPLNQFCDERQLSVGDRLKIFQQICHAVQHAHQKGIIHRDLKPTNILVESHDGRPVPKVIDFGLAKAVNAMALTERSLFTNFGAILGTPLYMAPEQAELTAIDVDTRADIYSLGVILYELLTGTTPLEKKRLAAAAWDEIRRVIKEEEPQTPSARLSKSEARASIAAQRQSEPYKLGKFVRGDLDWIVMKALAKERDRRYETANAFAADVERFLNHEPVSAGPPTVGYKLRKFVRRNRGPVLAASIIVVLLIGGIVGTTLGLFEAKRQEVLAVEAQRKEAERAEAEAKERQRAVTAEAEAKKQEKEAKDKLELATAVTAFLQDDLLGQAGSTAQANRKFEPDPDLTIKDALDRAAAAVGAKFAGRPLLEASIRQTVGNAYREVGQHEKAVAQLRQAAHIFEDQLGLDHPVTLVALGLLGMAYLDGGKTTEAIGLYEQVRDTCVNKLGPSHLLTLTTLRYLALAYYHAGKTTEAIRLLEQVRDAEAKQLRPDDPSTLLTLNSLGSVYLAAGRTDDAIVLFEHVRDAQVKQLGPDHPSTLDTLHNLATAFLAAGKTTKSLRLFEQVRDSQLKHLGPDHPNTLSSIHNLALAYEDAGKGTEAIALLEQVRIAQVKKLGPDHPNTLTTCVSLAAAYREAGKTTEAIALCEQVRDVRVQKLGSDHPSTLNTLHNLALAYQAAGRTAEAIALCEQVRDTYVKKLGPDHPNTLTMLQNLARAYRKAGKTAEAIALFEHVRDGMVKKLGPDHPETLNILDDLATAYDDAGKTTEAIALHEHVRDAMEKKLGPDHPTTLANLANLAVAYWRAKQLDKSIPLFEQVLASERTKLGELHPATLQTQTNLGVNYRDAGRLAEAIPLLEQARDAQVKTIGPEHANTLNTSSQLAVAYWIAKQRDKSILLFEQLLAVQRKKLGELHPDTLATQASLGVNYRVVGRLAEAIPLLEQVRDAQVKTIGPEHANTLYTSSQLAAAYWNAKQLDRSIPLFEQLLAVHRKNQGELHPDTLAMQANLGVNYRDAGRLAEAIPLLEQAQREGRKHESLAWVGDSLLTAYIRAGKSAEGSALVKENLEAARKTLPADSPQLAGALAKNGLALLQLKAWADAEAVLRECLAIREKTGPDAWNTFNARSMFGEALLGQKKYADAEPLLLAGYEGMKQREDKIPQEGKVNLTGALDRLVRLYDVTGQKDKADEWRKKLEAATNAPQPKPEDKQP